MAKLTYLLLVALLTIRMATQPATGDNKDKDKGSDKDKSKTGASNPPAASTNGAHSNAPAASVPAAGGGDGGGGSGKNGLIGFATLSGGTTGGAGGKEVMVKSLKELQAAASGPGKAVIKIQGTIDGGDQGAVVNVKSDKSLIGVGATAFLDGVGLNIQDAKNVIVQNLKITMSGVTNTKVNTEQNAQVAVNDGDCIHVQSSTNVWVDHCELFNIDPTKQKNQDLYDGLLDITHDSDLVTVSWNYFHDHHKVSLVGQSDSYQHGAKVTYHHNFFQHVSERLPSVRFSQEGHVFNNYYDDVLHSAVNSRMGACLKVENNFFEKAKNPIVAINSKESGKVAVGQNEFQQCAYSKEGTKTCALNIPYEYKSVFEETSTVKASVMKGAGVGKI